MTLASGFLTPQRRKRRKGTTSPTLAYGLPPSLHLITPGQTHSMGKITVSKTNLQSKSHVHLTLTKINAQVCIQAATGKFWTRKTQEMWILLSQAGTILMLSCPANVWAPAGVTGCRIAPCSGTCELSMCRWERNPSRVSWRTARAALAPCMNTRIQTSFWELAFTFSLWVCFQSALGTIFVVHWTQSS